MAGLLNSDRVPPVEEPSMGGSTDVPIESGNEPLGDEVSEAAAPVLDSAIKIAYGKEVFGKIAKALKAGGAEGFPNVMGTIMFSTMTKLEQQTESEISDAVLAEVGVELFSMLAEDLVAGGEIPGVTADHITQAMSQSINMWAEANPERFDREEFQRVLQEETRGLESEVAAATPAEEPTGGMLAGVGSPPVPQPAPAGGVV